MVLGICGSIAKASTRLARSTSVHRPPPSRLLNTPWLKTPTIDGRIDTTQVYTSIRPPQLKRAVSFYEEKALQMLSE